MNTEQALSGQRLYGQRGEYIVQDKIGQGGYAEIYQVTEQESGKVYAARIMRETANWNIVSTFLNGLDIHRDLDHPNIVRYIDSNAEDKFIIMGFAQYGSLSEKRILEIKETERIVRRIGNGLSYLHTMSISHLDIKPDNVLLTRSTAVLSDFDLANRRDHYNRSQRITGFVFGSPSYMSPERFKGDNTFGEKADQYGLAVTAYVLLTGRNPFDWDKLTEEAKPRLPLQAYRDPAMIRTNGYLYLHQSEKRPSLEEGLQASGRRMPVAYGKVDEVLQIGFAVNPQDRFPTVLDFADAFARASGNGLQQQQLHKNTFVPATQG